MVDYKRQTAKIVKVNDILLSDYVKQDGLEPNFIVTSSGKVSRVNIMGVVVDTDNSREMVLDDGSAKIMVKGFEEGPWFINLKIGDPVTIIGKPREWNNEKYVVPEIIRKIDNPLWLEVRKRELSKPEKTELPLMELINSLDQGDGADIQNVIESSKKPDAEKKIQMMLKDGEIFEIRPGFIKVL